MRPLFPTGYQGLADSRWSGATGTVAESVGIDPHSTPGIIKVAQKLAKDSASVIDELCKVSVNATDGSRLWFSSESGKIWRDVAGTYSLVYTNAFPAYDVRTIETTETSVSVSTQVNFATSTRFKPDGTIMYIMAGSKSSGPGDGNFGWIFQYTLSTAYDVSTATYASKAFAADTNCRGFWFKPDGTKLYAAERGGTTTIIEYDLSTAWDIATMSASGTTYDFSAEGDDASTIEFNATGTKMFLFFDDTQRVEEYSLSTAWDLSTISYTDGISASDHIGSSSGGGQFKSDGTILYLFDTQGSNIVVYQYNLSTAWDVSTATATGASYSLGQNTGGENIDYGAGLYPDDSGFVASTGADPETVYEFEFTTTADTNVATLSAEEFEDHVYWTTKNRLQRIPIANIDDFTGVNFAEYPTFSVGDAEYHPMTKQNLKLFIADGKNMYQVNQAGALSLSDFSVQSDERITTITPYDIDLLVGTTKPEYARILRWDTFSNSWSAEDIVFEPAVTAFIRDDNFVYACAGNVGNIYFYNGEKLEKQFTLRGDWSTDNQATVHPNAVGYYLGIPVFGLSTVSGTPCKMGLYTLGRRGPGYSIQLNLTYPNGNTYNTVSFGSIIVDGADMWVSSGDGVYKIDWSNKYEYAHFETTQLTALSDRSQPRPANKFVADYVSLPADTAVHFQYRDKYANSFTAMTEKVDVKKEQVRTDLSIKEVTSLQLSVALTVNGNDAPELENVSI